MGLDESLTEAHSEKSADNVLRPSESSCIKHRELVYRFLHLRSFWIGTGAHDIRPHSCADFSSRRPAHRVSLTLVAEAEVISRRLSADCALRSP